MVHRNHNIQDPGGGGQQNAGDRFSPYGRIQPRFAQQGPNPSFGGNRFGTQRGGFRGGRGGLRGSQNNGSYRGGFGGRSVSPQSLNAFPNTPSAGFGGNEVGSYGALQGVSLPMVSRVTPTFVQHRNKQIVGADVINSSEGGGNQERFGGCMIGFPTGALACRTFGDQVGQDASELAWRVRASARSGEIAVMAWPIDRQRYSVRRQVVANRVVHLGFHDPSDEDGPTTRRSNPPGMTSNEEMEVAGGHNANLLEESRREVARLQQELQSAGEEQVRLLDEQARRFAEERKALEDTQEQQSQALEAEKKNGARLQRELQCCKEGRDSDAKSYKAMIESRLREKLSQTARIAELEKKLEEESKYRLELERVRSMIDTTLRGEASAGPVTDQSD